MNHASTAKIIQRLKNLLGGSREQWHCRLFPLYGSLRSRQLETRIRKEQTKALYRVGLCFAIMGVLCLLSLNFDREIEGTPEELLRQGGLFSLEYSGVTHEISVEPWDHSQISSKSDGEILREARELISREMLGNNPDFDHVSGELYFPQKLDSGVYVRYETSDSKRISPQGLVDGIGAGEGIELVIEVTMMYGSCMESYLVPCTVIPPRNDEEIAQALKLRAETVETALERRWTRGEEIDGEVWKGIGLVRAETKREVWILPLMGLIILIVLYWGRFQEADRQREVRNLQIAEQIPLLMDQLILMMNAGLILSEAMEMAVMSISEEEEEEGLISDIRFLCEWAKETRRPVTALLCEYAVETGSAELVRFSSMLADHVSRGSASLIQQLKMERNYALESRWKQKEGKISQMEVKLSGPLALLLAMILLVTMGPVLIGM